MNEQNAIEVRNISKAFKVYLDRSNNIKDFIIHRNRRRYENREVLKDISFDVKKGEAIGIIGHNGCGKSTTLKLLTRISYPDSGSIQIKGRVSSLIELGAGFHPDMSGRENIYINASIFGLTRKEIDARLDRIIEFSEMAAFIDNPVRTYSSGMYMRLAFAVAINVDADVLLIDEILAVGDIAFQKKCFDKLKEIKANGTTIVIVSHALGQIEEICEKTYWIDQGLIRMSGKPEDVHREYEDYMEKKGNNGDSGVNNENWVSLGVELVSNTNYKVAPALDEDQVEYKEYLTKMIVDSQKEECKTGNPITISVQEICYGPYINSQKGRYRIVYDISCERNINSTMMLRVTEESGTSELARIPIKMGCNIIELTFERKHHELEFVLTNNSFTHITLNSMKLAYFEE